jgi:cyclophilin family peptidyl-prolyl cis-trans isomerase/HEAT repeat protein
MRFNRAALSAFAILFAACAATPPAAPVPQSTQLNEIAVTPLAEIMRREDNRQYDSLAFNEHLTSANEMVRLFAVRALGRIGNRAASGQLTRALSDVAPQVRAEAAFALGELGDSSTVVLSALWSLIHPGGEPAVEAVGAIGKLRTEYGRSMVERVLSEKPSIGVVQEALLAIWKFPRRPATTQLILPYLSHADEQVRWRAAYALTRGAADPVAIPALIQLAQSESATYAASFAVRGLRAAGADSAGRRADAMQALLRRINDVYAPVRINAILALGGYRDSTLVPQVSALLRHDDPNTRIVAAQTLGLLGGSQAIVELDAVSRTAGQRAVVRGAALNALVTLAPERALGIAAEWARSPDWLLRLYGARAAGTARAEVGLPLLRTFAGDRDPRVVVAAVEAAAGARDTLPAARALFIEQVASNDPFVRAAALGGLERYADTADQILLFDAYARAQRDTVPEAAVAALDAIARLAQRNQAADRAFRMRFAADSTACPHPDVRRALTRHFQVVDRCGFAAATRVYEQVVRDYVTPGMSGKNPRARIHTAAGVVELELLAADAPMTVRNFVTLAERRYFDGSRWHRVVPNFVIQDGDPFGNGSGGPGYAIRDEMNRVRYLEGALGMALSGPDTGGSQFFVTHSPQPHLDGGYTVFGRVVNGMDVVWRVVQDDVIERVEVIR